MMHNEQLKKGIYTQLNFSAIAYPPYSDFFSFLKLAVDWYNPHSTLKHSSRLILIVEAISVV